MKKHHASEEVRNTVLNAWTHGEKAIDVAERHDVCRATLFNWKRKRSELDSIGIELSGESPVKPKRGRPSKMTEEEEAVNYLPR